jgi:concanavalin A-like lectin/glucanase superfamily protein
LSYNRQVRIALLVGLAACSFSARARPGADAEGDASAFDARELDAPPDAPGFCDPADATLIACYEFEGTTADASANHLATTMTNVTFISGKLGMAAHTDATTQINVAENPALDPQAITIEAWIRAPLPPAGGRGGIVDNQGQWGFFLHEQGELQCITGGNVMASIVADTWTHVACTYDGTRNLYVNGLLVDASAPGGAPLTAGGTDGMSIGADNPPGAGSPLNGDIDQLRIFSVARTPSQICDDADCQL